MVQNINYFNKYSVDTWKECVFCYYWVDHIRYAIYVKLADSIVPIYILLVFYPLVLSIIENWVLKFLIIIVGLLFMLVVLSAFA